MKRMSLIKCRRSTEETCFIQSSSWEFLFVHQKYVKYDNCMIIKRKLSDTTFWIFRRTLPWSAFTWLPSTICKLHFHAFKENHIRQTAFVKLLWIIYKTTFYNYYYYHHNITIIKILNQLLLLVLWSSFQAAYEEWLNRKSGTIK